jgi:hypothetical protein
MYRRCSLDAGSWQHQVGTTQEANMATIAVPLVFALIGAMVYLLVNRNVKVARLGEITFFVGMLWLVYELLGRMFRI